MTWTLDWKGRVLEGPSWERGRIVEYEQCLGIVGGGKAGVGRRSSGARCCHGGKRGNGGWKKNNFDGNGQVEKSQGKE